MSDKELVFKYLNQNYFVIITTNDKETEFMFGAIGKEEIYSSTRMCLELNYIFKGIDGVADYFRSWFDESLSSLAKNFDGFLSECELVLGVSNWVVKHNLYGEINPELLTVYNGTEKATHSALRYLFDKWYDEKVIEASEKAMKNLYL